MGILATATTPTECLKSMLWCKNTTFDKEWEQTMSLISKIYMYNVERDGQNIPHASFPQSPPFLKITYEHNYYLYIISTRLPIIHIVNLTLCACAEGVITLLILCVCLCVSLLRVYTPLKAFIQLDGYIDGRFSIYRFHFFQKLECFSHLWLVDLYHPYVNSSCTCTYQGVHVTSIPHTHTPSACPITLVRMLCNHSCL